MSRMLMKVIIKNRQKLIKINLRKLKKDSLKLLTAFSLDKAELGILLVNDRRMKDLNRVHRGRDVTTDVLSFPLYHSVREIPVNSLFLLGDVVINLRAAERQAAAYDAGLSEEVRRLLIHGFLHLLGYDHESSRNRARRMKELEGKLRHRLETLD